MPRRLSGFFVFGGWLIEINSCYLENLINFFSNAAERLKPFYISRFLYLGNNLTVSIIFNAKQNIGLAQLFNACEKTRILRCTASRSVNIQNVPRIDIYIVGMIANKLLIVVAILFSNVVSAQDNYEIQVYGSQTQLPKTTMFELHSNYTFNGEKDISKGVLPSHHALHETIEVTTGITNNFEIGVYLFTAYIPGHGYQVVGSHLRPRVMAPLTWHLPVGLSLSTEIGYQKADYSSSTWSIELRPIIDKQWSKWYVSFNPTLGIALKSSYDKSTPVFEPNIKFYYTFFKNTGLGLEYYGDIGYVNSLEKFPDQSDAIFITYDLLNNPRWEFNMGAGIGVTDNTDRFVFKVILGRKVNWQQKK